MKQALQLRRWFQKLHYRGLTWAMRAAWSRLRPYRVKSHQLWTARLAGAQALEIGGPSPIFDRRGILPLYDGLARLDNVQFAEVTQWQGTVRDGAAFRAGAAKGQQLVREARDLADISDGAYDAVLASHTVEHTTDPLSVLAEWRRVTRAGGFLVAVVPEGARMWDRRRPLTTLSHLRIDRLHETPESDLAHWAEVLQLSDFNWMEEPWRRSECIADLRSNALTRMMHHHVFDQQLLEAMLAETGWRLEALDRVWPYHIVAIAGRA